MGEVVNFRGKREVPYNDINAESQRISDKITEEFFAIDGSYSNSELLPTYRVTYENVEGWDGKVTAVEKVPKKDSYMSLLSSGTCGLFIYDAEEDKIREGVIAELDSDIEETTDGKYGLYLIFKEELEGWVFEAIEKGNLYFTTT